MKHRHRISTVIVVLASVSLAAATLGQAGVPDLSLSTATSAGGQIMICPAGDGDRLDNAGATITVTLVDASHDPVVNFSYEDIWIESIAPGELTFCAGGNTADASTDVNGMTTFSGSFNGGGCTQNGLHVMVNGSPLVGSPLSIEVNSPDMNGDLRVDLCDYMAFRRAYLSGAYDFCGDINHDGVVNVFDITPFAVHAFPCDECPSGTPAPNITTSGEIGVFFDEEGTETGIIGVPMQPATFDFYVVALSAPDGMLGFTFGIYVDEANVGVVSADVMAAGAIDVTAGVGPRDTVVELSDCLLITGPTVLVHYQAILINDVSDSPIHLGPPDRELCDSDPTGPAYLTCSGDCDWRLFDQAYEGDSYINGMGPIATETTSWGQLKALFRH